MHDGRDCVVCDVVVKAEIKRHDVVVRRQRIGKGVRLGRAERLIVGQDDDRAAGPDGVERLVDWGESGHASRHMCPRQHGCPCGFAVPRGGHDVLREHIKRGLVVHLEQNVGNGVLVLQLVVFERGDELRDGLLGAERRSFHVHGHALGHVLLPPPPRQQAHRHLALGKEVAARRGIGHERANGIPLVPHRVRQPHSTPRAAFPRGSLQLGTAGSLLLSGRARPRLQAHRAARGGVAEQRGGGLEPLSLHIAPRLAPLEQPLGKLDARQLSRLHQQNE